MCSSCRRSLTRRELLRGLAAAGAVAALAPRVLMPRHAVAADRDEVVLTTTVVGAGTYAYLPFDVPPGVNHLHVRSEKDADAATGLGIFDPRGPGYQSAGFRGIYGEERAEFELAADRASTSFLPGPIDPGTWTIVVPCFQASQPTQVTVTVTLTYGPPPPAAALVLSEPGVVASDPGWYRGDLHGHTPESSDAWNSGTALDPTGWGDACRAQGLDFAAMTDHNVVSQNRDLGRAAGDGVLLLAGEEMTNWFHGHATVSGMDDPLTWFDWRQRPLGAPLQPNEATIREFVEVARASGAFTSAAHPFFLNLSWQFFAEAATDPRARTDGIEIWTGQWTPDCEVGLATWDAMLAAGQRIVANGGSDLHGVDNTTGFAVGTPTTVVHAQRLDTRALVAATKAGRAFITRRPDGVELTIACTGPGEQRQILGGTIYGAPGEVTEAEVVVRNAAGMALVVRGSAGVPVTATVLASDDEAVRLPVPILGDGYVRAEVRRLPNVVLDSPLESDGGMEAFCNPVFLRLGEPPSGHVAVDDTPHPGAPAEPSEDDQAGGPPSMPPPTTMPAPSAPPSTGASPRPGGAAVDAARAATGGAPSSPLPATGPTTSTAAALAALAGGAALRRGREARRDGAGPAHVDPDAADAADAANAEGSGPT